MTVTISDACIFLDLFCLKITKEFFSLDIDFHVPFEVINELSAIEREEIKAYQKLGKIQIHNCEQNDWVEIHQKKYPNTISQNDKISLYLSDKHNTLLLSTDSLVRQIAKKRSIEYHGILWVIDKLVEANKIEKSNAATLLSSLVNTNRFYQQNADFSLEAQHRISEWKIVGSTITNLDKKQTA